MVSMRESVETQFLTGELGPRQQTRSEDVCDLLQPRDIQYRDPVVPDFQEACTFKLSQDSAYVNWRQTQHIGEIVAPQRQKKAPVRFQAARQETLSKTHYQLHHALDCGASSKRKCHLVVRRAAQSAPLDEIEEGLIRIDQQREQWSRIELAKRNIGHGSDPEVAGYSAKALDPDEIAGKVNRQNLTATVTRRSKANGPAGVKRVDALSGVAW